MSTRAPYDRRPAPTGYRDGSTYYRPVQTVEGKYVFIPTCHCCRGDHKFTKAEICVQDLAQRLTALEDKS